MLTTILIIIGSLLALFLIAAAILPKTNIITVTQTINRDCETVFNYVKTIRNQEKYSKWVMADPNVKITYTGTDGQVGFKSAWKSEKKDVGEGEQEITAIEEGKRYDIEMRFKKPFKLTAYGWTTTQDAGNNQTNVSTSFKSTMPFPMNVMSALMKSVLRKDMEQNMANLKKQLEN